MAFANRKRCRNEFEDEILFRSTLKLSKGSLAFRTDTSTLDPDNPDIAWRLFLNIKTAQLHASEGKCASGDELCQSPTPPEVFQNFLRRSSTPTSTFRFTPHPEQQQQPQRRRVMEYQSMRPLLLFVLSRDDHLRGDVRVLQEWASQGGFDGCISDPAASDASLLTLFNPLSTIKLIDDNKRRGVSQTLISDMFTKLSMRKSLRAAQQQQQRRNLYSDVEHKQATSSLQSHASLPAASSSSLSPTPAALPFSSSGLPLPPHAPASAPINHSNLQSQQTLMRSFFTSAQRSHGALPPSASAKLPPTVQTASAGDGMDCSRM